ncbi:hypothetical protein LguiA_029250 [Lonicera macranthoides]
MDPTLAAIYSRNEVIRCIHMGLLCVQEDLDARPSTATIILMLNSYIVSLPLLEQPPFFFHSKTESYAPKGLKSNESTSKSAPVSVDEASITEVYPRMAPKDSTAKKKSRVEHDNGLSGSQQESPLVLATTSTHSTTGSTGPAPPTRSIRCTFVTTHVPTDSDTTGASSSNKRRGVVLGKKTAAITKEKDRTPVTYNDSPRGPPTSVRYRFVTDLSAYIKDRCPVLHPSWYDLPKRSEKMKVIRASTNKKPHSGGAKPFAARAEEYIKKGEQTPRNPIPLHYSAPSKP